MIHVLRISYDWIFDVLFGLHVIFKLHVIVGSYGWVLTLCADIFWIILATGLYFVFATKILMKMCTIWAFLWYVPSSVVSNLKSSFQQEKQILNWSKTSRGKKNQACCLDHRLRPIKIEHLIGVHFKRQKSSS